MAKDVYGNRRCARCGRPLGEQRIGRPRKWCGRSCRHRDYVDRKQQERGRPFLA